MFVCVRVCVHVCVCCVCVYVCVCVSKSDMLAILKELYSLGLNQRLLGWMRV